MVSSILSDSSSDVLHKSKIIEEKCDVESTDGIWQSFDVLYSYTYKISEPRYPTPKYVLILEMNVNDKNSMIFIYLVKSSLSYLWIWYVKKLF